MLPGKTIITTDTSLKEMKKIVRNKTLDEFVKNYKKSNVIPKNVRDRIFDMIQFGKCDVDEVAEVIDKQYCDFIEKIAYEMRGSEENDKKIG